MAAKRSDAIKRDLRRGALMEPSGPDRFLSTGSTLLNLACTGHSARGFRKGHFYHVVGDSKSGKTFLSLTCLAEASIDPAFKDYRFIFDNPEGGALMDFERFFGRRMVERLEPPEVSGGEPVQSWTVEQFYFHVDDALKAGRPFIYVLDSQDALSSDAEQSKFGERKKAARKGREVAGSYGDSKAKGHSADLRKLMGPLKESGSILLMISQTRDSFDMFRPSTYSGGRALLFYATLQLWSSVKEQIQRQIRGKKRQIGTLCKVRVTKSRESGRDRTVLIPIYFRAGIDDVGSCVDYLVSEGVWEEDDGKVAAAGIGPRIVAPREALVRRIEAEGLVEDLRDLVALTWEEVELACEVERRSRYNKVE